MAKRNGPVKVTYADGRTEVKKASRFQKKPPKSYYRTPAWWAIRKEALKRDSYRCQECGRGHKDDDPRLKPGRRVVLEVHHLTYKRFGHERLEDLKTLCRRCHATEHDWQRREKRALSS
jgi:5-methylcytosine-specific restriction endonuclease McrA